MSAGVLRRLGVVAILVMLVLIVGPVVGFFVAGALHVKVPPGAVWVLLGLPIALIVARLLMMATAERERKEAAAGYATVPGHPNLPRRHPRTGALVSHPGDQAPPVRLPSEGAPGPVLNGVSSGTVVLGASPRPAANTSRVPEGARFRWRFPAGILLGVLVVIALTVFQLGSGRPSSRPVVWLALGVVVILIVILGFVAVRHAAALSRVRASKPDAAVFGSMMTVDGADALRAFGVRAGALGSPFVVCLTPAGMELRRLADLRLVARFEWLSVASIEPGRAALPGGLKVRAIRVGLLRFRDRVLSLPLPIYEPGPGWLFLTRTANSNLDQMRARWREAQRAARNQRAASGGSVSSTDAGRPAQGSSAAVTDP
jgi:hypothetical protein